MCPFIHVSWMPIYLHAYRIPWGGFSWAKVVQFWCLPEGFRTDLFQPLDKEGIHNHHFQRSCVEWCDFSSAVSWINNINFTDICVFFSFCREFQHFTVCWRQVILILNLLSGLTSISAKWKSFWRQPALHTSMAQNQDFLITWFGPGLNAFPC